MTCVEQQIYKKFLLSIDSDTPLEFSDDDSDSDYTPTESEIEDSEISRVYIENLLKHARKNVEEDEDVWEDIDDEEDEFIGETEEEEDDVWEEEEDYTTKDHVYVIGDKMIQNKMNSLKNQEFSKYVNKITELEPDIIEILKTPLREKDKIKLTEYFMVLLNNEMFTMEWIEMRNLIKTEFQDAKRKFDVLSKFSENEREHLQSEMKRLKTVVDTPLKEQIIALNASDETKLGIYKKYKEMKQYSSDDTEYAKIHTWIKFALSIPYNTIKHINVINNDTSEMLFKIYNKLNEEVYGLRDVKEQILLFMNSKLLNPEMKGCNIGLLGAKGTGKTHIARCLSKVLDYPFEQISFGGINAQEILNGHDFTYIGSKPGLFVKKLVNMGCKNGIIYMDEFEKVSNDVSNMLLNVTDHTQNHEYRDNYVGDINIDLSMLWFIYSMNELPESGPLRDRLFTINIPGYNVTEKKNIVKQHLLPKSCLNLGLNKNDIVFSDSGIDYLLSRVSNDDEKGVRSLEKSIRDIVNKIAFLTNNNNMIKDMSFSSNKNLSYPVVITPDLLSNVIIPENKSKEYLMMYI